MCGVGLYGCVLYGALQHLLLLREALNDIAAIACSEFAVWLNVT